MSKNKLLEIMDEKNITYRDLFVRSGIAVSTLNYIANGKTDPKQSTMIAIAKALDMEVIDIFDLE